MALEVNVLTARSFSKVAVDGVSNTVANAVTEAGHDIGTNVIRVDGRICEDTDRILKGGETISVFKTKTVATAGVKGASRKSTL
jgi:hypothetical protein